MKLICAFVFAYADCWFSNAVAQILLAMLNCRRSKDHNDSTVIYNNMQLYTHTLTQFEKKKQTRK